MQQEMMTREGQGKGWLPALQHFICSFQPASAIDEECKSG